LIDTLGSLSAKSKNRGFKIPTDLNGEGDDKRSVEVAASSKDLKDVGVDVAEGRSISSPTGFGVEVSSSNNDSSDRCGNQGIRGGIIDVIPTLSAWEI
jgi:hypothetical protein